MSAANASVSPIHARGIERLFVTVGTDYHRFDRLIEWLDEWLADNDEVESTLIQRGTSAVPASTESVDYLQRSELIENFQQATVVVCHGGPATILESRSNGIVPIVVPREHRYDEHVNDHQVDFATRLGADGEIQLARTKEELFHYLDLAVERGVPEVAVDDGHTEVAVSKFEDSMVDLLGPRAETREGELAAVLPLNSHLAKVPVVFLGSVPRSGSTIISDLMNEHHQMINIGELVHLWERGVIADNLCGCGETFSTCDFWGQVGKAAFGGWEQVSGERMHKLQKRADRTRHIPALLLPQLPYYLSANSLQYGAVLSRLLRAIVEVSGQPIVVDTSKHVSTALFLRRLPEIDLKVVHIVRDPRGVAYSWSKVVDRPEATSADREMARLHPARLGLRWLWFNWAFSNMDRLGVPTTTLRYEDFVKSPAETLDQIFEFANVEKTGAQIVSEGGPTLEETGHSVAGNPRRFQSGPVEIRADEAWRTKFDPKMAEIVSKIARPMLSRYRYSKRAHNSQENL